MIHHGDCVDVMAAMEPASVDAIVTDPPYGLEFMGKEWDRLGDVGQTSHAGFTAGMKFTGSGRPTDRLPGASQFGSSNVKCRKCGKWQWDHVGRKCECVEPDFPNPNRHQGVLMGQWHQAWATEAFRVAKPGAYLLAFGGTRTYHRMTCAIEDAGWIIRDCLVWAYASGFPKSRALLKPAWEPIVMARKPGPLRELAIDACRIGTDDDLNGGTYAKLTETDGTSGSLGGGPLRNAIAKPFEPPLGRWPANVILTDPIFDGDTPGVVGGGGTSSGKMMPTEVRSGDRTVFVAGYTTIETYGDSGTYSRFFIIPKSARSEREPVLGGLPLVTPNGMAHTMGQGNTAQQTPHLNSPRANHHPTVKPLDLMRHLVRLVTPSGGLVLDPFLGSGTTGLAAEMEGFPWVGIEKEAEYVAIAEARLNGTQRGLGLG